jgi:hypothetical protein
MQVGAKRIVVLGTGGTIAGRAASAHDNLGYQAAQVGVEDLLRGVNAPQPVDLVTEQVAQVDSKDMDFGVWRALAARCAHWLAQDDVAGLVITHGTDTMEETAFFLQAVLAPAKPRRRRRAAEPGGCDRGGGFRRGERRVRGVRRRGARRVRRAEDAHVSARCLRVR